MDALYFGVSSDKQTTESQFEDLVREAERDGSLRDGANIRNDLARCVIEEGGATSDATTTLYRIVP